MPSRPLSLRRVLGPALRLPLLAFMGALALAGCRQTDTSALEVAVVGQPDDVFASSPGRLPLAGQLVRAATREGLVAFDAQGRVVNALADRWIVTDDGLSYIFRLRDGTWQNGDEITARSAKAALDAALASVRRRPLGLDLAPVNEVRVMAGRVIEIRLDRAMPFLLQLLAQPEMGLVHERQGGGPMTAERDNGRAEVAEGIAGIAGARLTPIEPSRLGMPQVPGWTDRTRQVHLLAQPAARAVDLFNEGSVDLVLGGQIQDFPLTRTVGILRGTIQLDPVEGLFGLHVVAERGILGTPATREAVAMAIDRPGLMAPFGVGGWNPATRLVAAGLDGDLGTLGERWTGQSQEELRRIASARVARWRAGQGGGPARVAIWLPEGGGSDILMTRLAADLAQVGIEARRATDAAAADLALVDEVARYPRATWYLNRLSCSARRGLCDPAIDARVAEAERMADPVERAALLTEAEAEITAANLFIPFGPPIRWSLVRGSVSGFAPNPWGWHPLMPLAWLPK